MPNSPALHSERPEGGYVRCFGIKLVHVILFLEDHSQELYPTTVGWAKRMMYSWWLWTPVQLGEGQLGLIWFYLMSQVMNMMAIM